VCAYSVVLLRTSCGVQSSDLCLMAGDLESSLSDRPCQLVVRQHADDLARTFVECCRLDAVAGLLGRRLTASKFTEGPEPSRVAVLHEGDVMELSLRGNIEVEAESAELSPWTRRFVYHSNLSSLCCELRLREVHPDIFKGIVSEQHKLTCFAFPSAVHRTLVRTSVGTKSIF